MSKPHLRELAAQVAEACARPRYDRLKRIWHMQNGLLQKAEKVPVNVHMFMGGRIDPQWNELIHADDLACTDPFERSLELQLRKRLFKFEQIPDDDVILPYVLVPVVMKTDRPTWGVEVVRHRSDDPGGAWKEEAPFADGYDFEKLRPPQFDVDTAATAANVDRARELLGDRLDVLAWDSIGHRTFDDVVALRGADRVMLDVIDQPEAVHRLTRFFVDGTLAYHRRREAAGFCDPRPTWASCRVHYEQMPPPASGTWARSDEWAYVTAQTSDGLSPEMFEQFCHVYHEQYAAEHGPHRVYYHGCECLDERMEIIARLPNLRRFHVSPWTSVAKAAETFGTTCVLECHVHPAETLMNPDPQYMRMSIRRILDATEGCILDINLSDIHTLNGHPDSLRRWAEIAQELTA